MRIIKGLMIGTCLMASINAQASIQWSSCETIVGVNNYEAWNNSVVLALSPSLPGCAPLGVTGGVAFIAGTNGVSAANINSFLASSLASFAAGTKVMIYYDNTAPTCTGWIIANGGQLGQCP
jgi:hypothetical protein